MKLKSAFAIGVVLVLGLIAQPITLAGASSKTIVSLCGGNVRLSGSGTISSSTCAGDLVNYPAYLSSVESITGSTIGSGSAWVIVVNGVDLDLSNTFLGGAYTGGGGGCDFGNRLFQVDTYNEVATSVGTISGTGGTYVALRGPYLCEAGVSPRAKGSSGAGGGGSVLPSTGGAAQP